MQPIQTTMLTITTTATLVITFTLGEMSMPLGRGWGHGAGTAVRPSACQSSKSIHAVGCIRSRGGGISLIIGATTTGRGRGTIGEGVEAEAVGGGGGRSGTGVVGKCCYISFICLIDGVEM